MLSDNIAIEVSKSVVDIEIDGIPYWRSEILGPCLGNANAGDGILQGDYAADPGSDLGDVEWILD
jgi:hypothetical protein